MLSNIKLWSKSLNINEGTFVPFFINGLGIIMI